MALTESRDVARPDVVLPELFVESVHPYVYLCCLLVGLPVAMAGEEGNIPRIEMQRSDGWNSAHRCLFCLHLCSLQWAHFLERNHADAQPFLIFSHG